MVRRNAVGVALCSLLLLASLAPQGASARRRKKQAATTAAGGVAPGPDLGVPDLLHVSHLAVGSAEGECGPGAPPSSCAAPKSGGRRRRQQRRRRQPRVAPLLRGPLTLYSLSKIVSIVGRYAHVRAGPGAADPPLPEETVDALKAVARLAAFNNTAFTRDARASGWSMHYGSGDGFRKDDATSGKGEPFWFHQEKAEQESERGKAFGMTYEYDMGVREPVTTWEDPFAMRRGADALKHAYQPKQVNHLKKLAQTLGEHGAQAQTTEHKVASLLGQALALDLLSFAAGEQLQPGLPYAAGVAEDVDFARLAAQVYRSAAALITDSRQGEQQRAALIRSAHRQARAVLLTLVHQRDGKLMASRRYQPQEALVAEANQAIDIYSRIIANPINTAEREDIRAELAIVLLVLDQRRAAEVIDQMESKHARNPWVHILTALSLADTTVAGSDVRRGYSSSSSSSSSSGGGGGGRSSGGGSGGGKMLSFRDPAGAARALSNGLTGAFEKAPADRRGVEADRKGLHLRDEPYLQALLLEQASELRHDDAINNNGATGGVIGTGTAGIASSTTRAIGAANDQGRAAAMQIYTQAEGLGIVHSRWQNGDPMWLARPKAVGPSKPLWKYRHPSSSSSSSSSSRTAENDGDGSVELEQQHSSLIALVAALEGDPEISARIRQEGLRALPLLLSLSSTDHISYDNDHGDEEHDDDDDDDDDVDEEDEEEDEAQQQHGGDRDAYIMKSLPIKPLGEAAAVPEACEAMPTLCSEVLQRLPEVMGCTHGEVTLMWLPHACHLPPRTGESTARLRAFLPLSVPAAAPSALLEATTTKRTPPHMRLAGGAEEVELNFVEGEVAIVDDSYEHEIRINIAEAENDDAAEEEGLRRNHNAAQDDHPWGVLLLAVDIWHPTLSAEEIEQIPSLYDDDDLS